jgi:DNA (cytosine-5)-methyltransferase 1
MNTDIKLLYIDLFCGAGGTSTGVESAEYRGRKCAKVIGCVNHDANAIASHAANHPDAMHFTEDIRTLELTPLAEHVAHQRRQHPDAFVVLWASLECTNFSKAKGGQPRDADSRTLAEHLFRYIEALNPDFIQIENVEEFMSWGDLDERGKPISKDAGRCYREWVDNVKAHGYKFDHRVLNSADFGAYTSRRRFFGIFARPEFPIVWPEPTHTRGGENGLFGTLQPWKPVREVLNFDDEGESIFGRQKPLVDATLERIYAGLIKFVAGGKDAFLIKYNSVNGKTGKHIPPGIDDPCPVVSTQGRLGVAKAYFLSRYNSGSPADKNISIDKPCGALTVANRFAPVQIKFLTASNGGNPTAKVFSIDKPCRAITTSDNKRMVSTHFLTKHFSGKPEDKSISVDAPAGTITCRDHHSFISAYYGNGENNSSVNMPSPVITTKDRLALVDSQFLCSYNFKDNGKSIDAPSPTILTKDRLSLVSPRFIANEYSGSGQLSSIDSPNPAVLSVPKQKLVTCCPWVMNTSFGNVGSSIDAPAQVITANRKHHYLMNPQFSSAGGSVDNPCFTLIARMDKMPPYLVATEAGGLAIRIEDTDSPAMVKIKEFMALYGIVDIKMRMLRIPELKQIMGFPKDYVLVGSQADQKKFIGNAVEVNTAKALCEALVARIVGLKLKPLRAAA